MQSVRLAGGHGLEVGARAEGHIAGTGQDAHPDLLVLLEAPDRARQGGRERAVDRVALRRAVQRDERRMFADLVENLWCHQFLISASTVVGGS